MWTETPMTLPRAPGALAPRRPGPGPRGALAVRRCRALPAFRLAHAAMRPGLRRAGPRGLRGSRPLRPADDDGAHAQHRRQTRRGLGPARAAVGRAPYRTATGAEVDARGVHRVHVQRIAQHRLE